MIDLFGIRWESVIELIMEQDWKVIAVLFAGCLMLVSVLEDLDI